MFLFCVSQSQLYFPYSLSHFLMVCVVRGFRHLPKIHFEPLNIGRRVFNVNQQCCKIELSLLDEFISFVSSLDVSAFICLLFIDLTLFFSHFISTSIINSRQSKAYGLKNAIEQSIIKLNVGQSNKQHKSLRAFATAPAKAHSPEQPSQRVNVFRTIKCQCNRKFESNRQRLQ